MSVRKKLLLLSATPVFITGALLLVLFIWGHARTSRAYESAMVWERHAQALQHLDWAARFYFDNVADGLVRDPMPHEAESKEVLALARAESLSLSRRFSLAEQAADRRLDANIAAFVEEGERVGKDSGRLNALAEKYWSEIRTELRARVEQEEAGSARAIGAANALFHRVRTGGVLVALLALLTALGASAMAVRKFGGRVATLQQAAARVATGQLEGEVPVTSGDELGQLAGSLNSMIQALRDQRTKLLGFVAAVAHDLRNPLGPMRHATEMLVRAPGLASETTIRKSLAVVSRQIERLTRMADDLLDAASIEAGELTLKPRACDLVTVAREVVELYVGSSPRHEVRLSAPAEPATLVCDPARIAQVLENLVNNAIKYSPAGGSVDVTVTAGNEEAIISVADTGAGIESDMFEAIFEPFRRVSPSKGVVPGVGLGLSTCRRIVVAHGGRIEVASTPGRGTTFLVHLPRQVAALRSGYTAPAERGAPAGSPPPGSPRSIWSLRGRLNRRSST